MNHECNNPECPIHGNSPQAIADRALRQKLATNDEAMDVIRVLAANIHSNILVEGGIAEGPLEQHVQMQILKGNSDDDPVVQGLIHGMIVLLRDHYPTQQWVGLCQNVPPAESIFRTKLGADINDIPGMQVHVIRGFDELFEFLTGRKR